jgi:hypothetical protein
MFCSRNKIFADEHCVRATSANHRSPHCFIRTPDSGHGKKQEDKSIYKVFAVFYERVECLRCAAILQQFRTKWHVPINGHLSSAISLVLDTTGNQLDQSTLEPTILTTVAETHVMR